MDTESALGIDEQICFALYSASRALTARYRDLLAPVGLTYPQYLVLLVLWEGQPVTVGALGERLALDSGTLSPLVRRLDAAGLVERRRSTRDERSVEMHLTAAGSAMQERTAHIPSRICDATGLGFDEIVALRDRVADLAHHVRASAEAPVDPR